MVRINDHTEAIAAAAEIAWILVIFGVVMLAPVALRYFTGRPLADGNSSLYSVALFGTLGFFAVCLGLVRLLSG